MCACSILLSNCNYRLKWKIHMNELLPSWCDCNSRCRQQWQRIVTRSIQNWVNVIGPQPVELYSEKVKEAYMWLTCMVISWCQLQTMMVVRGEVHTAFQLCFIVHSIYRMQEYARQPYGHTQIFKCTAFLYLEWQCRCIALPVQAASVLGSQVEEGKENGIPLTTWLSTCSLVLMYNDGCLQWSSAVHTSYFPHTPFEMCDTLAADHTLAWESSVGWACLGWHRDTNCGIAACIKNPIKTHGVGLAMVSRIQLCAALTRQTGLRHGAGC